MRRVWFHGQYPLPPHFVCLFLKEAAAKAKASGKAGGKAEPKGKAKAKGWAASSSTSSMMPGIRPFIENPGSQRKCGWNNKTTSHLKIPDAILENR